MMDTQFTLALVKPDAFSQTDDIVTVIKNNGFVIADCATITLTADRAAQFYAEHKGRFFYEDLITFMTSGPLRALILRKKDAITAWRTLIGPTSVDNARDEAPSSIRARFGTDNTKNAVHGSDSPQSAATEVAFFFPNYTAPAQIEGNDAKEYLNRTVSPTLTKALVEMCTVAPPNAFEWLGLYLLRIHAPQSEYFARPNTAPPSSGVNGAAATTVTTAIDTTAKTAKRIFFVLGGPGSGKGTQCAQLVEQLKFDHFSAGDLLRAEVSSGSDHGTMIGDMIKEGKIVPGHITIGLLKKAIDGSSAPGILIDGFPRQLDQAGAFEKDVSDFEFVLFFDCPEEEMERRLLERGKTSGRSDDNIESIRKRFNTFVVTSMPVIQYYEAKGKVHRIDATKSVEDVTAEVGNLF